MCMRAMNEEVKAPAGKLSAMSSIPRIQYRREEPTLIGHPDFHMFITHARSNTCKYTHMHSKEMQRNLNTHIHAANNLHGCVKGGSIA